MTLREKTTWTPRRGVSIDALAVGRLREYRQEQGEEALPALRKAYDAAVRAVAALPDNDAQAVLLSAASPYQLDLLWAKAARPQTTSTPREKKIAAYVNDLTASGVEEAKALELAERHFPARQRRRSTDG